RWVDPHPPGPPGPCLWERGERSERGPQGTSDRGAGNADVEFLIPGLRYFLVLGSILFALGMYGVLSRRNAIGILLSIELMLNGVALLMVAFSRYLVSSQDLAGQMFAIFIITQAAAEAAVGLAIIIAVYRQRRTVQVDQLDLMKG